MDGARTDRPTGISLTHYAERPDHPAELCHPFLPPPRTVSGLTDRYYRYPSVMERLHGLYIQEQA